MKKAKKEVDGEAAAAAAQSQQQEEHNEEEEVEEEDDEDDDDDETQCSPDDPRSYRNVTIKSLKDLVQRAEVAKKQHWIQDCSLAEMRRRLGLQPKKENMTPAEFAALKCLFVLLIKSIMESKEGVNSKYLKAFLADSKEEPEGAILFFQFLYYADANSNDQDFVRIADLLAKEPAIGDWCRNVLIRPADYHDALVECCLVHLQKFACIISNRQKLNFLQNVVFQKSTDLQQGLLKFRQDLLLLTQRPESDFNPCGGVMSLAHALYLHNSIEISLFDKNSTIPLSSIFVRTFQAAIEKRRADFPSQKWYWLCAQQLTPYCARPSCIRKAPFACCAHAVYCSSTCRDEDWKRHRKGDDYSLPCDHGKKTKVDINFTPLYQRPELQLSDTVLHASLEKRRAFFQAAVTKWSGGSIDEKKAVVDAKQLTAMEEEALRVHFASSSRFETILEIDENGNHAEDDGPSEALQTQDKLLAESPEMVYFLIQPWGKMIVQMNAPKNQEFKELRSRGDIDAESVRGMLKMLSECCPGLKKEFQSQLEAEYCISLSDRGLCGDSVVNIANGMPAKASYRFQNIDLGTVNKPLRSALKHNGLTSKNGILCSTR